MIRFPATPFALLIGRAPYLLVLALVALAVLLYALPPAFDSPFGLNHAGVGQFAAGWGVRNMLQLGPGTFAVSLACVLVIVWLLFAAVVAAEYKYPGILSTRVVARAEVLALLAALLCPPALSTDVYAYAAYGRIAGLLGLNPYHVRPRVLVDVGDPIAPFLGIDLPSVYGPLWTLVSTGIVSAVGSVMVEVVVLKLCATGALAAATILAGRLAAHLNPGREGLARLIVGLNPLLLLEGPATGHNDVLTMALFLAGALYAIRARAVPAMLLAGLAASIKPLPVLAMPWLLLALARRAALTSLSAVQYGLLCLAVLFPAVLMLPFGHDLDVVNAFITRVRLPSVDPTGGTLRIALIGLLYLRYSLWVVSRRTEPDAWLTAWLYFATPAALLASGVPFPWYLTYSWMVQPLRNAEAHRVGFWVLWGGSLVLGLIYAWPINA
ncbi:MAG: hypothetical protein U1E83_06910 [Methylotetracoccus sp.]